MIFVRLGGLPWGYMLPIESIIDSIAKAYSTNTTRPQVRISNKEQELQKKLSAISPSSSDLRSTSVDIGIQVDLDSDVLSSQATHKNLRDVRVDCGVGKSSSRFTIAHGHKRSGRKEKDYKVEYFWDCCQCATGTSAGMALTTLACPVWGCCHYRCMYCPGEWIKIPSRR